MATSAGIEAQIGMAAEVTYGTYVAPTRFYEFTSESLKYNISRIQSAGLRAGRRTQHRWKPGVQSVTGDINMELAPQDLGLILEHILGDVSSTTGADPYTHTWQGLADIDDRSMTIQVGRPDEGGTIRPFSYLGCKFTQLQIGANVDEFATTTVGVYGREETTAEALEVATYDTELEPFVFTEGSLTVASTEICVVSFDFTLDLALATDRHRICATANAGKPKKALVNGMAEISGSFTADFEDLTAYNRYINGTEAELELVFNAGADKQLTVNMNVRFDGETPNVDGPEMLDQPLQYVATSGTSDADAITVTLINSDATP